METTRRVKLGNKIIIYGGIFVGVFVLNLFIHLAFLPSVIGWQSSTDLSRALLIVGPGLVGAILVMVGTRIWIY